MTKCGAAPDAPQTEPTPERRQEVACCTMTSETDGAALWLLVFFGFGLISGSGAALREYHYVNLPASWAAARSYCRLKHTDLATFESAADFSRLNRPGEDASLLWIGLNDDPASWKGNPSGEENSWRWSSTGDTASYQRWNKGQPNNYDGHELCTKVMRNQRWYDVNCDFKFPFVCYNESNHTGHKNYTLIGRRLTWPHAQAYCRTHHTDLATVENRPDEEKMLAAKGGATVWIGLYRVPWKWSDESGGSFRHWERGQPNNNGSEFCAAEKPDHSWSDVSCERELSFWCHGAPRSKKIVVKVKIETVVKLSDPAANAQILLQLREAMKTNLGDFKLSWRVEGDDVITDG